MVYNKVTEQIKRRETKTMETINYTIETMDASEISATDLTCEIAEATAEGLELVDGRGQPRANYQSLPARRDG